MKIRGRAILLATLAATALHVLIDVIDRTLTPLLPAHPFVDTGALVMVFLFGGLRLAASFAIDAGAGILYVILHGRGSIPSVGTGATGGAVAGMISRLLALAAEVMMTLSALVIHAFAGTELSVDTFLGLIIAFIPMLLLLPIAGIAFGGIGGALATVLIANRSRRLSHGRNRSPAHG